MKQEWIDIIVHMTGCGSHINEFTRGYRNYFCSSLLPNDEDYIALSEMVELGYIRAGGFINGGDNQYFYATEEGCRAAGLDEKYIQRIFNFNATHPVIA